MTFKDFRSYETSSRVVLKALGIDLVEERGFKCCGYPLKSYSFKAFALCSARNLALARRKCEDIVTMCSCCYGNLKHVEHALARNPGLKDEVNDALGKEGLRFEEGVRAIHFLDALREMVGREEIKNRIKKHLKGLRVAVHYGCHLLRPKDIVQFDNPFTPTKLDRLVEVTGAESVAWSAKLDCCGSPLMGTNDELSMDLTEKKLSSAKQAGADCLCVVCPYCFQQFNKVQEMIVERRNPGFKLPVILFQQLLGVALGIDKSALGLEPDRLPDVQSGNPFSLTPCCPTSCGNAEEIRRTG
jgi:heterodisulfide reductase subunit B